jgi:hypothetical protein
VRGDYVAEVLADNPIGYWRFEEQAGLAADSSGNSRDGTYMGGVTPGLFPGALTIGGTAAAFDGATSFIDLPGVWGGVGMSELTIESWVNTSDPITGTFQAILAGHDPNAFAHFQLNDVGGMGVYTDAGFVTAPIVPATPTGEWRHVVMTAKSGETKVYVNGAQFGATVTAPFTNILESNNVDIGIGHMGERWFSGLLDEVAIYDTALSGERILSHFVAGGGTPPEPPDPPQPASLLAHWSFDQDGSDATGNHPGTLGGGATITGEAMMGNGALDLRDVSGYVDIPTPVLDGEESFSVAMFLSVDSLTHGCCSALLANDSWSPGTLHVNIGTGSAVPEAAVNGNPAEAWGRDAAVPTDGTWFHLAYTYDGETGTMTPYINGVAGTPGTGGVAPAIGVGALSIGAWDTTGGGTHDRFLDGRIDDLRIYSGVLTPAQVVSLVPEPSTGLLVLMAVAGMRAFRRRR